MRNFSPQEEEDGDEDHESERDGENPSPNDETRLNTDGPTPKVRLKCIRK
jgi:hypothetical protein